MDIQLKKLAKNIRKIEKTYENLHPKANRILRRRLEKKYLSLTARFDYILSSIKPTYGTV